MRWPVQHQLQMMCVVLDVAEWATLRPPLQGWTIDVHAEMFAQVVRVAWLPACRPRAPKPHFVQTEMWEATGEHSAVRAAFLEAKAGLARYTLAELFC